VEETENTQRTRSENRFNNLLYLLCESSAFSAVNPPLNCIVIKNKSPQTEIIDLYKYYSPSELFNILLNYLLPPFYPVSRFYKSMFQINRLTNL